MKLGLTCPFIPKRVPQKRKSSLLKRLGAIAIITIMTGLQSSCTTAGENKEQKKMSEVLTVGSFNVRVPCDKEPNDWPNRGKRLLSDLDRLQFDVFGVQEAVPMQIADIEAAGYKHLGHGRNPDRSGESAALLYRPERLEALSEKTIWLSETPDVYSLDYGTTLPRVATYARFRDRRTGREFVFANVHLQHRNAPECRANQIAVLLKHLEKYLTAGVPVILTGDFNAPPDEPAYQLTAGRLHDAAKISQTPPALTEGRTFHGYKPVRPETSRNLPIDYVFVSDGIEVQSYESVNNFDAAGLASSDHYPQKALIRF